MAKCMLTTVDNPYDPFTQFDLWYNYDVIHGYRSSELLGRIANTSNELTEALNEQEIENAIDQIVVHDEIGIYKKAFEKN